MIPATAISDLRHRLGFELSSRLNLGGLHGEAASRWKLVDLGRPTGSARRHRSSPLCTRGSTRESLGRSNIGRLHLLCSVCLPKNQQMHRISAATILHPAPASSMLRRGGPAQCLPIATILCHGLAV